MNSSKKKKKLRSSDANVVSQKLQLQNTIRKKNATDKNICMQKNIRKKQLSLSGV